jgi:hypothetical protein
MWLLTYLRGFGFQLRRRATTDLHGKLQDMCSVDSKPRPMAIAAAPMPAIVMINASRINSSILAAPLSRKALELAPNAKGPILRGSVNQNVGHSQETPFKGRRAL